MICLPINLIEVVDSLREYLKRKAYTFAYSFGKFMISAEITASKGKEQLIIEAIGETVRPSAQNLIFALGKALNSNKIMFKN